jgi:hypothetical protein
MNFAKRNLTGLAALVCLILAPGFATAACPTPAPSFTYTPVAAAGGVATLGITTAPGCFWSVASNSAFIRIVSTNHGYGSGAVVFQVLPNTTGRARRGTFGTPASGDFIPGRSSAGPYSRFIVTVDQNAH